MKLSETLDKTISDFCRNGFHGASENHCAHFVCHVLQVSAGYTCKSHTGKPNPGACLRVQELFAECPTVGTFASAPAGMCVVFVTDAGNVDLPGHTMRNVSKKHVGIFSSGHVYHYSNTTDLVVRQTPPDFLKRFQNTYGGKQALFYGTFPSGAVIPEPEEAATPEAGAAKPPPAAPAVVVAVAAGPQPVIREEPAPKGEKDYYVKLPGAAEFYLARSFFYENKYRGLFQPKDKLDGPKYAITDFKAAYETVAGLMGVIAAGESKGHFNRINSYDRAAFTFGFFQLAAHTPNDNLILLFRRYAQESAAFQALFPDLKVVNGVLHRVVSGTHSVSLETAYPRPGKPEEKNLHDFMKYLNPDGAAVDSVELSCAARLVRLANSDAASNALQVNVAAQITMRKMRGSYALWYDLDGAPDLVCTAIADIHHQGRGTKAQVKAALASSTSTAKKVEALCKVGEANYASRCATLKSALAQAKKDGHLGISVFDKASGLFKPSSGWPA